MSVRHRKNKEIVYYTSPTLCTSVTPFLTDRRLCLSSTRRRKTESRTLCNMHKIGKDRACGSEDIFVDRQTDTQTDILITILRNRSHRRSKKNRIQANRSRACICALLANSRAAYHRHMSLYVCQSFRFCHGGNLVAVTCGNSSRVVNYAEAMSLDIAIHSGARRQPR